MSSVYKEMLIYTNSKVQRNSKLSNCISLTLVIQFNKFITLDSVTLSTFTAVLSSIFFRSSPVQFLCQRVDKSEKSYKNFKIQIINKSLKSSEGIMYAHRCRFSFHIFFFLKKKEGGLLRLYPENCFWRFAVEKTIIIYY